MTFQTAIYLLWLVLPLCLYLCTLWSLLERKRKGKTTETGDLARNSLFVTVAVAASFIVHRYLVIPLYDGGGIPGIPKQLADIATFPLVLILSAKIAGPSRLIRIEKDPDLKKSGRRR
jgi:hypothetical protein